jgi:hypothetical protein
VGQPQRGQKEQLQLRPVAPLKFRWTCVVRDPVVPLVVPGTQGDCFPVGGPLTRAVVGAVRTGSEVVDGRRGVRMPLEPANYAPKASYSPQVGFFCKSVAHEYNPRCP